MLSSNQIINDFINSTKINIDRAVSTLSYLTGNQINWKASSEIWSVGECINHLITTNKLYLTKINNIEKPPLSGSGKDFPYSQSFMGRLVTKVVDPENVRKYRTFKAFFPEKSAIERTVVKDYVNFSKQFVEQISKMHNLDLKKLKLSSPANYLVRLNLGDVLIIIQKHDVRHLNQAETLITMKNFPEN